MPAGLARYWATHARGGASRRRRHAHRRARRGVTVAARVNPLRVHRRRHHHHRRRNPSVRGIVGQLVPMTMEAATGAVGSLAIDWLWGQVNPRLPANLQSVPGKLGIGDAVKVAGTVAVGTFANRMTRGFAMKAARGALTVQLERIIRASLPDNIRMQLAYANPAPVVRGTYFTGPNRIYRGAGVPLRGMSLSALQRPGGPTQLLSALQRPGGPTQLLSQYPTGLNMPY